MVEIELSLGEQTHEYVLCGIYGELDSLEGELSALVQIQLSTFLII